MNWNRKYDSVYKRHARTRCHSLDLLCLYSGMSYDGLPGRRVVFV